MSIVKAFSDKFFVIRAARARFRRTRLLLVAVVTAAIAGNGLMSTAHAGPPTPPATPHGYATFSDATLSLTCTSGAPASLDVGFHWNASHLTSSDNLTVSVTQLSSSDGQPVTSGPTIPSDTATISAGSTGSYNHDFTISGVAIGNRLAIAATANSYNYLYFNRGISCTAPLTEPGPTPSISVSPLSCDNSVTVTYTNTASTSWGTTIWNGPTSDDTIALPVDGDPTDWIPTGTTSRTYTDVTTTQPLTFGFTSGSGPSATTTGSDIDQLYAGQYGIPAATGCATPTPTSTSSPTTTPTTTPTSTPTASSAPTPSTTPTTSPTPTTTPSPTATPNPYFFTIDSVTATPNPGSTATISVTYTANIWANPGRDAGFAIAVTPGTSTNPLGGCPCEQYDAYTGTHTATMDFIPAPGTTTYNVEVNSALDNSTHYYTVNLSPTPSPTPTPTPTVSPTPSVTTTPTPTATVSPTTTPTTSPTATPPAPTPSPTSTPTASTTPAPTTPSPTPVTTLTDRDGNPLTTTPSLTPGDTITVHLSGLNPGETLAISLHSTVVNLGSASADSHGDLTTPITIPTGFSAGNHHIEFTNTTGQTIASIPIQIHTAAAASTTTSGVDATNLASTGRDETTPLWLATLLLSTGLASLTIAWKRRTHTPGKHSQ